MQFCITFPHFFFVFAAFSFLIQPGLCLKFPKSSQRNLRSKGRLPPTTPEQITQSLEKRLFDGLLYSGLMLIPTAAIAADSSFVVNDAAKYFFAGGICASFSHAIAVPFDVIKTRKQTSPELATLSVVEAGRRIVDEDGPSMLLKGLGPTITGYAIQGSLKYGWYETFKPMVSSVFLSMGMDNSRLITFMIAGALAECIGSTFLSPFEASRIRLVANPNFSTGIVSCLNKLVSTEGVESLFTGLPAILTKQLPYTIVQLVTFEAFTSNLYSFLPTLGIDKPNQFGLLITFSSALGAAILSSLASQPGDTLLSAVNKSARVKMASSSSSDGGALDAEPSGVARTLALMKSTAAELGLAGLFTGTKARLLHVSVIVVVQLLVYDYIKQLCGIPPTGSH